MKTWILQIIFTLLAFSTFSQSKDWKQINTPHKTAVELLYQSSDGTLFGVMTVSREMAISKNNGMNWEIDKSFPLFKYFYWRFYNNFKEDKNGKIFCFFDNIVFYFDPIKSTLVKFIELDEYEQISDIAFLYNGDMVVSSNDNFLLYSDTGVLRKTHKWGTHSAIILPSPDGNGKNYVINSSVDELWEFSDDLSFVGNKKVIEYGNIVLRQNDRIFNEEKYSDDGGTTWQSLSLPPNEYFSYFNIGHDGKLYYASRNGIYVSADSGNSFTKKDIRFDDVTYISATTNNTFVVGANSESCFPEIFLSNSQDPTLQKINNEIGSYHSDNVYAGIDEFLTVSDCYFNYKTKNPIQDWQKLEIGNEQFSYIEHFLHLSNGEILTIYDYDLYKSKDNGKNWNNSNQKRYYFYDSYMSEKNGKLFIFGYDSIYFSNDFGDTWESKFTGLDFFGYEAYSAQYSDKFDIYYYDVFISNGISKYNVITQEKKPINIDADANIGQFITSFDGKTLYLTKAEGWPYKYTLETSYDYGETFTSNPLYAINNDQYYLLKADHLGNIYLYSEKSIRMSSDDGQSWIDITPDFAELVTINDLQISYDNYIYLATTGMGILKYKTQLSVPNGLKVFVYDDLNKNCQRDINEPPITVGKVTVNDNNIRGLDKNGEATFGLHTSQNKVSVMVNETLYEKCQAFYDTTLDSAYTELSIPLKAKKYCADLQASISTPFLRRCFDNTYYGQICNNGNLEAENVMAKIKLDQHFDFIETGLPIVSHVGDELVLKVANLKPGECQSFIVKINLSCDADLGQEHCMEIDAESDTQKCDESPSTTAYIDCQENIGSYDPNDKAIFVNGIKDMSYLEQGDKLEYMIRFQNTGTDTAYTVKIQDPISSKFDVTSIEPVVASHSYTWSVDNGILNVVFNNIMLVDSFKNEPLSHGFIKFEITLNRETKRNQEVSNLAGIFFDFNEPIITNEVNTLVGKPVSTIEIDKNPIYLFPNPTNDFINIKHTNTSFNDAQVIIYNESGKSVLTTQITTQSHNQIDVNSLPPGFYIVQVIGNKSRFNAKFVKL
jgi:uncharacterized repeat protein (TIGR01451 family)